MIFVKSEGGAIAEARGKFGAGPLTGLASPDTNNSRSCVVCLKSLEVEMKTLLLAMALAGMVLPVAGCETLADTPKENGVRVAHAVIIDFRQVPNDLEYILFLDRPSWLSRYPIPND
jgi:hypothetical protein